MTSLARHAVAETMRLAGLVLTWAMTATAAGVILWVPLGAIGHAVSGPLGVAGIMPALLLFLLYSPYVGLRALVYATPVLAVLFVLWALLCRRRPALDSPRFVALFALLIALPAACLVSATMSRGSGGFSWSAFASACPAYFVILWGAIASPRWLLPPLAFGAFSPSDRS